MEFDLELIVIASSSPFFFFLIILFIYFVKSFVKSNFYVVM